MAAETNDTGQFLIDGKEYAIPTTQSFTLDEWKLMEEYADLRRTDFARAEDAAVEDENSDEDGPMEQARLRRINCAGFWMAMLHVSYLRAHPDAKPAAVKKIVGAMNPDEMFAEADEETENDPAPLESTPAPERQLPEQKETSSGQQSRSSQTDSETQAVHLVHTGTSG